MQLLPQPFVIPMRVAQSRVFTMGNITREHLYLETCWGKDEIINGGRDDLSSAF
jgi:hypothetical protein